jgi:hypothetical protein
MSWRRAASPAAWISQVTMGDAPLGRIDDGCNVFPSTTVANDPDQSTINYRLIAPRLWICRLPKNR